MEYWWNNATQQCISVITFTAYAAALQRHVSHWLIYYTELHVIIYSSSCLRTHEHDQLQYKCNVHREDRAIATRGFSATTVELLVYWYEPSSLLSCTCVCDWRRSADNTQSTWRLLDDCRQRAEWSGAERSGSLVRHWHNTHSSSTVHHQRQSDSHAGRPRVLSDDHRSWTTNNARQDREHASVELYGEATSLMFLVD